MPSLTADSAQVEELRSELQLVLHSETFERSPSLSRLLSYLCEKTFAGESQQIKEYSIALDVFGRPQSFDQDEDSIVRVQANRLRKRLAEYYADEGRSHKIQITIPVGQYVPDFIEQPHLAPNPVIIRPSESVVSTRGPRSLKWHIAVIATAFILLLAVFVLFPVGLREPLYQATQPRVSPEIAVPMVGLPVGDEIRILAGSTRTYVDRSGKLWNPDAYFTAGTAVRSPVQHIWRTQDATIYRTSRQGDFRYDIPLKPGIYELHLHFAETFYGPEDAGGGEGSRVLAVTANGKPLLSSFDIIGDSGESRAADVKVFTDLAPASDGFLHLNFSSLNGRAMVSAIEILPGYHGHLRPVRIVARDVPYYSNESQWWGADVYFKGGLMAASEVPASGTDDPELYETERWGHFSYAIPVTPGKYTLRLYFVERGRARDESTQPPGRNGDRVFDVFCNGEAIVQRLDITKEAGTNQPLMRKVTGLEPNAQGKLMLEFSPVNQYATVSAIEVVPD